MSSPKSTLEKNPNVDKCLLRDNYKCVRCGSKKNIIVHHIDNSGGQSIRFVNNSMDNLIVVCRYCHAREHNLTSNYYDVPEMRAMGMTYQQIGDKLGITRQRVCQLFKGYKHNSGITIRPRFLLDKPK